MITPAHMVFFHGYTLEYAEQMDPAKRLEEHTRLHEDETGEFLDHAHEERVVEQPGKHAGTPEKRPCSDFVASGHTKYHDSCPACQAANSDAPEWTI